MKLQPGDQVKLTDRYAATLMAGRKRDVNWHTRRGVCHHQNRDNVFISWTGRVTIDSIPKGGVEKAYGSLTSLVEEGDDGSGTSVVET